MIYVFVLWFTFFSFFLEIIHVRPVAGGGAVATPFPEMGGPLSETLETKKTNAKEKWRKRQEIIKNHQ